MRDPESPGGFQAATAKLVVRDAKRAIEFYRKAFGARTKLTLVSLDGTIAHGELEFGDLVIMVAEENPEWGSLGPESLNGTTVHVHLRVDDVDAVAERAVAAGASVAIPVADQFYGDRSGRLIDPFGHLWVIETHKEEIDPKEMQKRFEKFLKDQRQ